jgi:hypothetical protein
MEALRYEEEKLPLLGPYCEVVDELTQAHCIRWPPKLMDIEVERYLCTEFGIETGLGVDYPYGRLLDFLPDIPYKSFDAISLERLREQVLAGLPPQMRSVAERKLRDRALVEAYLWRLGPEQLGGFIPGFSFSNQEVVRMVLHGPRARREVLEQKFQALGSFRNLIDFSVAYPPFKRLCYIQDDKFAMIGLALKAQQALFDRQNPIRSMPPSSMRQSLTEGFVEQADIEAFCEEHRIPVDEARRRLLKSKFATVPSIKAAITFTIEYYKRHRGTTGRAREPKRSDLFDIQHILCLPYVDIYSTDAFFAEVARRCTTSAGFEAEIVTNTPELLSVLETRYGLH